MRISFIGHASILVETRGVRVLSDPWWSGPCFGAQWWNYPSPHVDVLGHKVDFIYISHGHHDHLHPGTLRHLNKDAVCLVSRGIDVAPTLQGLGFSVIEIDNESVQELRPGIRCRIIETHADDTLLVIEDGARVCVNLNDSLHAAPAFIQDRFISHLRSLYPRIDFVFCGYGVASHFPNCYDIPGKDKEATAAKRQAHFNRQWVRIIEGLAPTFAFPFAADVAFLEEDLLWVNEPTANSERPTAVFKAAHPDSSTTVMDIAPGFVIDETTVVNEALRQPVALSRLRDENARNMERANNYGVGSEAVLDEVLDLLRANVTVCHPYLVEVARDYRFLLQFRNYLHAIAIVKKGTDIDVAPILDPKPENYDIVYVTRLHYLRWSLTTPHGHEILFVGSGGIFRYAKASDARRNLHRELTVILTPHTACPPSRFGTGPRWLYGLKRAVKSALGWRTSDLYDLATWTEWRRTH